MDAERNDPTRPPASGRVLSRREALRRGALAGAVVWTVPAVQVLSMTSAAADTTSAAPHPKPRPKPTGGNGHTDKPKPKPTPKPKGGKGGG